MNKLTPLCCGLLLVLAGSLGAAETELIDTNTPWQTYLVTGPTLRWQNGAANVWPSKGGGQLRVGAVQGNSSPFDPATADLDKSGFSPREEKMAHSFHGVCTHRSGFSPRPPAFPKPPPYPPAVLASSSSA